MKNIGFYIDNSSIADVDASEVKHGNPGIGGTEYLILLVASLLSERNNGLKIKLFMKRNQNIPASIDYEIVDSLKGTINRCEQNRIDALVFKHDATNITDDVLHTDSSLKLIVWCHVFICYWELNYYANNASVYRLVFVGREMQDLYRDHKVFNKSTFIYNCVSLEGCRDAVSKHPYSKRSNIVTYVGSIVPFKGFHLLANAWPKVVKNVPDAQLYVIGSGKVYDSNLPLGKFGIAESSYEKLIMKPLCADGKLLQSVHFMGKMGMEKKDILLKTRVGVPNPTGITETFCLSAVEMQTLGAMIATIKAPGYIDTVRNGVLFSKPSDLADAIIMLLKRGIPVYDSAMNYFEKNFSYEAVLTKWEKLFSDEGRLIASKMVNTSYRLKWLKEIIRRASFLLPLNRILPPIERVLIFVERRFFHEVTFMDSNLTL